MTKSDNKYINLPALTAFTASTQYYRVKVNSLQLYIVQKT